MTRAEIEINQADKQAAAVRLRRQGADYRTISATLNCSLSTAHSLVKRGLDRVPAEDVATLRQIEGQRLTAILNALWPAIEAGDVKAAAVAVNISNRLSGLYGLDSPVRIEGGGGIINVMFAQALMPHPAATIDTEMRQIDEP